MSWLEALILGLIQGLTEFLPVSSSGHLQIFSTLFGIQGEENLTFAVAVHAATVCSTIVVLRNEIWDLLKGLFRFSCRSAPNFQTFLKNLKLFCTPLLSRRYKYGDSRRYDSFSLSRAPKTSTDPYRRKLSFCRL